MEIQCNPFDDCTHWIGKMIPLKDQVDEGPSDPHHTTQSTIKIERTNNALGRY